MKILPYLRQRFKLEKVLTEIGGLSPSSLWLVHDIIEEKLNVLAGLYPVESTWYNKKLNKRAMDDYYDRQEASFLRNYC